MNINKEQHNKVITLFNILLFALITIIFAFFWLEFYRYNLKLFFRIKGSILIIFIYLIHFMLFYSIFANEKFLYSKLNYIIVSRMIAIVFTNIFTYLQISLYNARFFNLTTFSIMTILEFSIIYIISFITLKVYLIVKPKEDVLIIHRKKNADMDGIIEHFKTEKHYNKISLINIDNLKLNSINNFNLVVLFDLKSIKRNPLIKYCYQNNIPTIITEKISDILISNSENINMNNSPVIKIKSGYISQINRIIKRSMDIIISSILLITLSPIMLIIALLIKFYDKNDILFIQKRYTINNTIFNMYKFTSMTQTNSKSESLVTTDNDARITKVGKFIRRIRFDELPQLVNILKGDMSLVGPRPERIENHHRYIKEVPEFNLRLNVKAGLTGYAQIYGKYSSTPYEKIKLDLIYIQKYSILLDIKLLFLTFKVLFIKENTKGFKDKVN